MSNRKNIDDAIDNFKLYKNPDGQKIIRAAIAAFAAGWLVFSVNPPTGYQDWFVDIVMTFICAVILYA